MCGFAGIISNDSRRDNAVKVMAESMSHRGPDDSGYYFDNDISIGFRRLAIIDLSEKGAQPMKIGKYIIVFNGEIYNFKEIREKLNNNNIKLKSNSDTEVLLMAYTYWGVKIFNEIIGMFAFAIWDCEYKKLLISRDHFGKKPLYYYLDENQFIFSSEINAIKKTLSKNPEISEESIFTYLSKGYYDRTKTIYSKILTLDSGEYAFYYQNSNNLTKQKYWVPRFNLGQSDIGVGSINESINTAIKRRFNSDVPVGICLSGGVDSSIIALKSKDLIKEDVTTYTVKFDDIKYDESKFVKQLTDKYDIDNINIKHENTNLEFILTKLVNAYGEPFGDDSAIPAYTLYENLKEYGKVFLTGDGADELFGGYKDSKLFLLQDRLNTLNGITNIIPNFIHNKLIYAKNNKLRALGHAIIMLNKQYDSYNALRSGGWNEFTYRYYNSDSAKYSCYFENIEEKEKVNFLKLGSNNIERYLNKSLERLIQQFLVKSFTFICI